jgi:hypothetical protein
MHPVQRRGRQGAIDEDATAYLSGERWLRTADVGELGSWETAAAWSEFGYRVDEDWDRGSLGYSTLLGRSTWARLKACGLSKF